MNDPLLSTMKRTRRYILLIMLSLIGINLYAQLLNKQVAHALRFSEQQVWKTITYFGDSLQYPRSTLSDGTWKTVTIRDWTSGFFPGSLWYIFEKTHNPQVKNAAVRWTEGLESIQYYNGSHDIGFIIFCSYGNAYRFTGDERYKKVLLQAAQTLITRYNPTVGCIRSWDNRKWSYPVIIDNMMNLELLFWASQHGGTKQMYDIAYRHAEKTMMNHFRPDFSTYHVVAYDSVTGNVLSRGTHQGFADSSCWARGQAWAVYGFTMAYRYTKDERFLRTAQEAAKYFLTHLPTDFIPYWDFSVANIPGEPRDVSAAAIVASALFELQQYGKDSKLRSYFRESAQRILASMCVQPYLAEGTSSYGILNHAVGHKPAGTEIDVSLIYADYYFLEALVRYQALFTSSFDAVSLEKKRILDSAKKMLAEKPITITQYPASRSAGGIQDYFSEGDYWWPNPEDPNGPYIQRDGMTNPDNFVKHREVMTRFSKIVSTLSAAYIITGDKLYARHVIRHLRAWFVNPKTKMNPHLLYAQAIKGRVTGRGIGIIDTIHLLDVIRSVEILLQQKLIEDSTKEQIIKWFREYLHWLTTHQYGLEEREAKNNHGTWWVAQVAALARLVGDTVQMQYCRDRYKTVLLPLQMGNDGSFPLELKRTKPYNYSLFNLEGFATICQILSTPEDNLWKYTLPDGRNVYRAMEFLVPFIEDKTRWPFQKDAMYFEELPGRRPMLLFAGIAFERPDYLELWSRQEVESTNPEVQRNIAIKQPILWIQ